MTTNRYDILITAIIVISLVIFLAATIPQLEQRKKTFICRGYLQHWGSALRLAHADQRHFGPASGQNIEQWLEQIKYYIEKAEALQCPGIDQPVSGGYSYKINHNLLRHPLPRQKFQLPQNYIIMFDGHYDRNPVSSRRHPSDDVSYRHLGAANFLLGNGNVIYRQYRAEQRGENHYRWGQSAR